MKSIWYSCFRLILCFFYLGKGVFPATQSLYSYRDEVYSFDINLGTPPQKLRVMLSFGDVTVQVVDAGCKECCHKRRYDATLSTSAGKCTSDRDVKTCVDKMETFGTTTNEFTFIDIDIGKATPFDGYWQGHSVRKAAFRRLENARLTTSLDSASIGSASSSGAWRAEFDPSSAEIMVPKDIFEALNKAVGAYQDGQNYGTWLVDCSTDHSGLVVELKFSGQALSVPFHQVVYQTGNRCVMRLRPRTDGYTDLWSIGLPLMRQYCTLFDFENDRLAFATTKATPTAKCLYPPKEVKYTTPCDAKEQSSSSTNTPIRGPNTGKPPQSTTSGSSHVASLTCFMFILSALLTRV